MCYATTQSKKGVRSQRPIFSVCLFPLPALVVSRDSLSLEETISKLFFVTTTL